MFKAKLGNLSLGRKLIYVLLFLLALTMLYPIWYVLCCSLSTNESLIGKTVIFWPQQLSFESYRYVLKTRDLMQIYCNTVFVIVMGTVIAMMMTIGLGYGISKKPPGYRLINYLILIPMLFSGGMIPTYVVIRSLGLINSLWALIWVGGLSSLNVFIMRNFFAALPESLEEAAVIEGANQLVILLRIALPLSLAGLSTIALFYGVGYWNMYFSAIIYINRRELWTIQVFLKEVLITSQPDVLGAVSADSATSFSTSTKVVQMTVVIISILPVMMIYPFIQRYFVKGVMVGAVKG